MSGGLARRTKPAIQIAKLMVQSQSIHSSRLPRVDHGRQVLPPQASVKVSLPVLTWGRGCKVQEKAYPPTCLTSGLLHPTLPTWKRDSWAYARRLSPVNAKHTEAQRLGPKQIFYRCPLCVCCVCACVSLSLYRPLYLPFCSLWLSLPTLPIVSGSLSLYTSFCSSPPCFFEGT